MSSILNITRYLPKSLSAFAGILTALVLTFSAVAAPAVRIEADLGVANVTNGDTSYSDSVSAGYDEVIKVQLWYHNMEEPDSGLVAENLKATFDLPEGQGETQTISATVGADNSNQVTDSVTVNLGRSDAYLEYIDGSAKWRHNAGTNDSVNYQTEEISNNVVTTGVVLEDAEPCFNFEATVTILLRVRVPSLNVEKQVSTPGSEEGWKENVNVQPGDRVKFLFTVTNDGNDRLTNVTLGDVFPAGVTYVPGTTVVTNGNHPDGVDISTDDIANGGLNLGNFAVGGYSYVTIEADVADAEALECGMNTLINKGVVKSDKVAIRTDEATVKVNRECEETPIYRCDALNVTKDGLKVTANAQITAENGATVTGVSINFGDGTVVDENNAIHTYAEDGNYTIQATVNFDVDGDNETDQSKICSAEVNFETPVTPNVPQELPNTGPGSVIAAIFGAGSVTTAVKSWLASRRTLRSLV